MKQPKISSIIRSAWNIYRTNFKTYYSLALVGSFWMVVPIYGWAKYTAMMGLLTRLAHSELVGNPESVVEAKRNIKPKMWSFLVLGWKVNWHLWIKVLFLALKISVVFAAILCVSRLISVAFPMFSLLLITSIVSCVYYYLFASRLHLYELPLVVEKNINARKSIYFSKQLVEGYSLSTLAIIFIFTAVFAIFIFGAGVATNPILEKIYDLIVNIYVGKILILCLFPIYLIYRCSVLLALLFVPFPTSIFLIPQAFISLEDPIIIYISPILYLPISALFIPLWQSIKAVIYYRLKLRNDYRALLPERST